jgi:putative hydrolase of the HAD superfamily
MTQIDTVVFDVGRVLFNFTFVPFENLLNEHGYTAPKEDFVRDVRMYDYERGQISSEQFLENLNSLVKKPLAREEAVRAWTDMFTPVDEMLELAARLRETHRTFLLSNTTELHWEFLDRHHRINDITHGVVTSYEAREMKPNPDIYRYAEDKFQLIPARTVFIDDLEANVISARNAGWHGIHHVNPGATSLRLKELGVIS